MADVFQQGTVGADHLIRTVRKNGREEVRVAVRAFRGSRFADVRLYTTDSEGASVPTPKGVALRADMIPVVIAALEQAARELGAKMEAGR